MVDVRLRPELVQSNEAPGTKSSSRRASVMSGCQVGHSFTAMCSCQIVSIGAGMAISCRASTGASPSIPVGVLPSGVGTPSKLGQARGMSDLVDGGRAAVDSRDWAGALALLREADEAGALGPSDVERLAEAAFWMGHLEECIEARERAFAGLVDEGDVRAAALVALHLAFHHAGREALAVAAGWLESAATLLADLPECVEQGWLSWIQGVVAGELFGDRVEALRLGARTAEIGRAVGDRDVESLGVLEKGVALIHLGRVDEGLALLDQVMARAVSGLLGPWASAATYCGTISTCATLGDYRRAAEWITEVRRRPVALRSCEFPGDCRIHRAQILQLRGDWEEAEVEAARACDELASWDAAHVAVGLYELGTLSLRRGDVAAAEHAFREVEHMGGSTQPGRATLELLRGRTEPACASP